MLVHGRPGVDPSSRESEPAFYVAADTGVLVGHGRLGLDLPAWEVFIVEPLENALAPVRQMVRRLALALAVTLAVALAIGALGADRVARPLVS